MKITQEHYNKLQASIIVTMSNLNELIKLRNKITEAHERPFNELLKFYEQGRFPRAEKVKDLQTRFCFDLYHEISNTEFTEFKKELYTYLNDDHIETALRKICPKVTKKY